MGTGALVVDELFVVEAEAVLVDGDHRVAAEEPCSRRDRGKLEHFLEHFLLVPGFVHVAELGADLDREVDQVALVGGDGAAAEHGNAQVVLAHLGVLGEAARAEDHALGGPDHLGARGVGDLDADDLPVLVHHDLADLGVGGHRRALGFGVVAKLGDDIAAIAGLAVGVERVGGAALLGDVLVEMGEVVGRRRAVVGVRHRRGQGLLIVEGFDHDAGVVVVRLEHAVGVIGQTELGVTGAIERGEAQPRHIFERISLGVGDAGRLHIRAIGNPELPAGLGGGAAGNWPLLVDLDLGAAHQCGSRGGERRAAGADDDDVGGLVPVGRLGAGDDADAQRHARGASGGLLEEVAARDARRKVGRNCIAIGAMIVVIHGVLPWGPWGSSNGMLPSTLSTGIQSAVAVGRCPRIC